MNYKTVLNSLRFKMLLIFVCFTIPLVALLIVENNYAIDVVRKQVAQSNKNLLTLYMEQIDKSLEEVDKYLYNMAAVNTDLLDMELSYIDNSQKYYLAKLRLSNMISADINNYKYIDMFFIYSSVNQDLLTTQDADGGFEENETIVDNIKELLKKRGSFDGYSINQWLIYKIDKNYYIFHVVKVGTVYIGAWVNAKNLMVPLSLVDLGKMGKAVLVTNDGAPMNNENFIRDIKIKPEYNQDLYNLTGGKNKFLIVGEKSKKGAFSLLAIIPDSVILEKLPYIQKIVSSLVPILSLFFLILYLAFLKKIILHPVNKIVKAMRKIKNGDLDVQINQYATSNEFELMNDTFNSMVLQIRELKIHVYEEKINKQKAELKHLQLQINPHFFLNSLNVIFQLAQVKDFRLIQEMSVCLVEYFRFMFRSNSTFVLLEDELKNTRNYLQIQKMRFPGFLDYTITVPDSLSKYLIPPLLVQTFVENSIKYAVTLDEQINIYIDVDMDESTTDPRVKITIHDTGKGFDADILQKLQMGIDTTNPLGEEHIGIWNVKQRLLLLYKGQANIKFSNRPGSGACVEIDLPMKVEY